jgi:hypothetical protein
VHLINRQAPESVCDDLTGGLPLGRFDYEIAAAVAVQLTFKRKAAPGPLKRTFFDSQNRFKVGTLEMVKLPPVHGLTPLVTL